MTSLPDAAVQDDQLRRILRIALVIASAVLAVALAVTVLFPTQSFPASRLVPWQLHGMLGPGLDPTTIQTATVVPVDVAEWPTNDKGGQMDDSWLVPVVNYTPTSVIITLHTSDAYESQLRMRTTVGMFDTGGWVQVHLGEPLGGRALLDGSQNPAAPRPYP